MVKLVTSHFGSKRCASPSGVQKMEAKNLGWLRPAWKEGAESGDYRPLDIEAIKAEGQMIFRDEKLKASRCRLLPAA